MSPLPKPYKMGFIGLLSILAIAILPVDGETNSSDGKLYGMLTLVQYDENNNEVFAQSIHNRLVNTGETFLLEATFSDGVTHAEAIQIGAICIAQGDPDDADEAETAANFDTANTQTTGVNCKITTTVDVTTTQGTAIIGPLTFDAPTNITSGETIQGIGICNSAAADYTDCATASGILFAVINTADVTLLAAETVQITYTFDITSDGN